jgi:5-(carboxyamino)imidazole ribonucleotide synthase
MKKVGILGGGQLGKMLCLAAADWDLEIFVMDTEGSPAQPFCKHFVVGDIKNYDDVLRFGQLVDVLTIEIEHVNSEALHALVAEGKTVHPNPTALDLIKDKGLQKAFYAENEFLTSKVFYYDDKKSVIENIFYPAVWKSRKGGYDGKGVFILREETDLENLPDEPCILEELVNIDKEISLVVCRNESGQVKAYPSVEMFFDPKANLLDLQLCPSGVSEKIEERAQEIAKKLIKKLNICGLLAVEMFFTKGGQLLINEVAPRPHNSGHHTIEAVETSQFEQHLRGIMNLPLGSTKIRLPSVLINLVGSEGHEGDILVEGMEKALNTEGVHVHLYGKKKTKPFRKMGHVTVLHKDLKKALENAIFIKRNLKIISHG